MPEVLCSGWLSLSTNSGPSDLLLTGVRSAHFESQVLGPNCEKETGCGEPSTLVRTGVREASSRQARGHTAPLGHRALALTAYTALAQGLGHSPSDTLRLQAFLSRRRSSGNPEPARIFLIFLMKKLRPEDMSRGQDGLTQLFFSTPWKPDSFQVYV